MKDLFIERNASPMLIAQQMEAFDSPDWIYELKMDGFRCLAYVDRDSVDFRNKRNMQMLSRFPELREVYRNVGEKCILDGEVVVLVDGMPDFYRLQKRTLLTDRFKIELESKRFPASFVAFDCIYKNRGELVWKPLMERRQVLSQLVREDSKIAVSRYVETEGSALYRAADEKELEGVVAKRKESIYLMGRRTKDWVKFKRMADEEFIVTGYIQKGAHTFSLVLAKYREGILVYQGHVTSGVTAVDISELSVANKSPFQILPAGMRMLFGWCRTGCVWWSICQICRMHCASQSLKDTGMISGQWTYRPKVEKFSGKNLYQNKQK